MSNVGQIPPKYDLNKVYQTAFGYHRPPYPVLVAESKTFGVSPEGLVSALKGSFNTKSLLGTEFTLPTKLDGWQLPGEPTISIRGGKRVKETELNRLDPKSGKIERKSVLEEISISLYEIRLRGIIMNDDDFNAYPEADVRRLREIIEKPGAVSIENPLATIFNINQVAILDPDFKEVFGYVGAQAYELILLQSENLTLELELNEPERL